LFGEQQVEAKKPQVSEIEKTFEKYRDPEKIKITKENYEEINKDWHAMRSEYLRLMNLCDEYKKEGRDKIAGNLKDKYFEYMRIASPILTKLERYEKRPVKLTKQELLEAIKHAKDDEENIYKNPLSKTENWNTPKKIYERAAKNISNQVDVEGLKKAIERGFKELGTNCEIEIQSINTAKNIKGQATELLRLYSIYDPKKMQRMLGKLQFCKSEMVSYMYKGKKKTAWGVVFWNREDPKRGAAEMSLGNGNFYGVKESAPETAIHEFAHVAFTEYGHRDNDNLKYFNKELKKIHVEYEGRIKDKDLSDKDFVSEYASTNIDEFMAECIRLYIKNESKSEYVKSVGYLFDKCFKRKDI